MLIAFANNQELLAAPGTTSEIVTDPVSLERLDRASVVANIHYIFPGGSASLTYVTQVSNDGTSWVDQGPTASLNSAGVKPPDVVEVHGGWMRIVLRLTAPAGPVASMVALDLHARLDKVSPDHTCSGCGTGAECAGCKSESRGSASPSSSRAVAADGGSFAGGTFVTHGVTPSAFGGLAALDAPPPPPPDGAPVPSEGPKGEIAGLSRRPWGDDYGATPIGGDVDICPHGGVWGQYTNPFTGAPYTGCPFDERNTTNDPTYFQARTPSSLSHRGIDLTNPPVRYADDPSGVPDRYVPTLSGLTPSGVNAFGTSKYAASFAIGQERFAGAGGAGGAPPPGMGALARTSSVGTGQVPL